MGSSYQHNYDLMHNIGNIMVPSFDEYAKSTITTWVRKLYIYFHLNLMTEVEAIKFPTLHFDGEAHGWLYHGLVTLGNSNITSYEDFTQRLVDRFNRKDHEIHFRELVQLK
jgi:hypothetical protein